MAYIVTTKPNPAYAAVEYVPPCRAVATLEEARKYITLDLFVTDPVILSEFGGTINLPDGTAIEVAYVSDRVIDIDAFNAREATQ